MTVYVRGLPVNIPSFTEEVFLGAVDELCIRSTTGYALLTDLCQRFGAGNVMDMLEGLEETGIVEEPIVGMIRRA